MTKPITHFHSAGKQILFALLLCCAAAARFINRPADAAVLQTQSVVSVSAANYLRTVTPDGIAAAFGAGFTNGVQTAVSLPLPTTLGGVSVTVGGRSAGLFFVSAGQINYLVPPEVAPGEPEVVVRLNGNITHRGTIFIAEVALVVFTFNADGTGVPAATAVRAIGATQTFETIAQRNGNTFVPKPINLGAAGVRRLPNSDNNAGNGVAENVRMLLGGLERTPSFAGAAPGFAGVDQLNLELPRELIARGKVKLAAGFTSNESELEFDGLNGPHPPVITSFAPTLATAGETLNISGSNFSAVKTENAVSMGGTETREIDTASANQLIVRVPYGVESGSVVVRTAQGGQGASAAAVAIRTTVSGFVEDTQRRPLPGVRVRAVEANIAASTNAEGAFLLRDMPPTARATAEIEPTSLTLNFPSVKIGVRVVAGRDHHLNRTLLQQVNGPGLGFGSSNLTAEADATLTETVAPTVRGIQTSGVAFMIADETTAIFPNGATSGTIFLSIVENSRVPVQLPPGIFSSTVAQLTPFGTKLTPGGKLTFPNADGLAANAQARLYRLDQTAGSATLGQFIDAGAATVSADARLVETATNAITETSIFFVAVPQPVTTVTGRVVDSDGTTPVRRAVVRARGQETFTDGNGGFTLPNVPLGANNQIDLEASFLRPTGRTDRVQRNGVAAVANGLTRVTPDLVLPAATVNRPPTLLAPATLELYEAETRTVGLIVGDPDPNQTVQVTVGGAAFASITQTQGVFSLRLAPGAGTAGNFTLVLTATDNLSAATVQNVAVRVIRNSPPVLTVPGAQSIATGQPLAFTVNASDPDAAQTITFSAANLPSGATFNAATRQFVWTPQPTQIGAFTVSVTARDNGALPLSDTKTVVITVANTTPPVANAQTVTTNEDTPRQITLTGSDAANRPLTYTITAQPTRGTLSGTPPNVTYTPTANLNGADSFRFRVSNAVANSAEATVTINVTPVNDPPIANAQSVTTNEDTRSLAVSGNNLFAGTNRSSVFVRQLP